MKSIICEARGPIIIISYNGGATNDEYEEHLHLLTRLTTEAAQQYPRVGQVHDATRWVRSNAHQRQLQADWIKANQTLLRGCGGFSAFVFKSALVRGGLTAVMWLASMPGPYRICATVEEALAWIEPLVIVPSVERR